jgi:uncharacterized membrane protein
MPRLTGRLLVRSAFLLLSLWLAVWLGLLGNAPVDVRLVWAAVSLLPLAVLAPFLFRSLKLGYAWSGFLSLGYFAQGVAVALASTGGRLYGAVEIFLSLLLFFASSAALREARATP